LVLKNDELGAVKEEQDVKHEMAINFKFNLTNKLNMVVNMRLMNGLFLLKTMLLKIQTNRELFILQLEDGNEVFIHKDIS